MLEYDFENSVGYWLVRTAQACERAVSEELAPEGITYRQFQVLGWLVLEGDLAQNELAERMREVAFDRLRDGPLGVAGQ